MGDTMNTITTIAVTIFCIGAGLTVWGMYTSILHSFKRLHDIIGKIIGAMQLQNAIASEFSRLMLENINLSKMIGATHDCGQVRVCKACGYIQPNTNSECQSCGTILEAK